MWERSPSARLVWGLAWSVLLAATAGAALSTGRAVFIAAFLLVVAVGAVQLVSAGPTSGRLWDSPLTKMLYAYLALSGVYFFARAALESPEPLSVGLLVALIAVIALQWLTVWRGSRAG